MKYEWKKNDKQFYLPKEKPERIIIPEFKFFTIEGKGNPNDAFFAEYIGILYSLSYALTDEADASPDSLRVRRSIRFVAFKTEICLLISGKLFSLMIFEWQQLLQIINDEANASPDNMATRKFERVG